MNKTIFVLLILSLSTFAKPVGKAFLEEKANQGDSVAIILLSWGNVEKARGDSLPSKKRDWQTIDWNVKKNSSNTTSPSSIIKMLMPAIKKQYHGLRRGLQQE